MGSQPGLVEQQRRSPRFRGLTVLLGKLQRTGKSDDCGGMPYLNSLAQSVPSAANLRRYAEIVRERSVLRKIGRAHV